MSEEILEPNEQWFFDHPIYFPWDIMDLDRPMIGPLHGYISVVCSRYEKDSDVKRYLSGGPHWSSLVRHATQNDPEERNDHIILIHRYCLPFYEKRQSERRNVEVEVCHFLEGYQPFRDDFFKKLLTLWKGDRIYLRSDQLRKRRSSASWNASKDW